MSSRELFAVLCRASALFFGFFALSSFAQALSMANMFGGESAFNPGYFRLLGPSIFQMILATLLWLNAHRMAGSAFPPTQGANPHSVREVQRVVLLGLGIVFFISGCGGLASYIADQYSSVPARQGLPEMIENVVPAVVGLGLILANFQSTLKRLGDGVANNFWRIKPEDEKGE